MCYSYIIIIIIIIIVSLTTIIVFVKSSLLHRHHRDHHHIDDDDQHHYDDEETNTIHLWRYLLRTFSVIKLNIRGESSSYCNLTLLNLHRASSQNKASATKRNFSLFCICCSFSHHMFSRYFYQLYSYMYLYSHICLFLLDFGTNGILDCFALWKLSFVGFGRMYHNSDTLDSFIPT